MNAAPRRFRRGDTCAERPGLVFLSYNGRFEKWVTPEKFQRLNEYARSPERRAWVKQNRQRPEVRAARQREYERTKCLMQQRMETITHRFKQGDTCPTNPSLVFYRYQMGKEMWLTPDVLKERTNRATKANLLSRKRRLESAEYRQTQTVKQRQYARRNRKRLNDYARMRRRDNIEARIASRLQTRIRDAAVGCGSRKLESTSKLIGCSISELKSHLENQFLEGMSWERISEIEFDHIIPVVMFRLEHVEQQRLAFNYRNLRPMWAKANRQKSDLINHNGQTIRARELRNIIPFQQAA